MPGASFPATPRRHFFHDREGHWNDEGIDQGSAQHPSNHHRAQGPARDRARAPRRSHNGTQPRMNAKEVIKIGRRRMRAPLSAASDGLSPFSYSVFAKEMIRIAFFAARPISMIRPIWT